MYNISICQIYVNKAKGKNNRKKGQSWVVF